jgi:hypothetical protein
MKIVVAGGSCSPRLGAPALAKLGQFFLSATAMRQSNETKYSKTHHFIGKWVRGSVHEEVSDADF